MSVGTVLVFISYLASLYTPINSITYTASILRRRLQTRIGSSRSWIRLRTSRTRRTREECGMQGHVRYEGVTFGYERGRPVLKGVSLEAGPARSWRSSARPAPARQRS